MSKITTQYRGIINYKTIHTIDLRTDNSMRATPINIARMRRVYQSQTSEFVIYYWKKSGTNPKSVYNSNGFVKVDFDCRIIKCIIMSGTRRPISKIWKTENIPHHHIYPQSDPGGIDHQRTKEIYWSMLILIFYKRIQLRRITSHQIDIPFGTCVEIDKFLRPLTEKTVVHLYVRESS